MKLSTSRYQLFAASSVLAMGLLLAGCSSSQTDPREGFTLPDAADFSSMDRVAAFTAAHQKFSMEYALTDWKDVHWNTLYQRHLPKVQAAAMSNDRAAYFMAPHDYLFEIDDGHVTLPRTAARGAIIDSLIAQQSGAGYCLGLAQLDDGTVIVAKVPQGEAAANAGNMNTERQNKVHQDNDRRPGDVTRCRGQRCRSTQIAGSFTLHSMAAAWVCLGPALAG